MIGLIKGDGLTKKQLQKETRRNKFSEYLPWVAYDEETKIYLNQDNTAGYIWECLPLNYAGDKVAGLLEGLINIKFPEKSVLQFLLYADEYIKPYLDSFINLNRRSSPLIEKSAKSYYDFLQKATRGCSKLNNIPVRNYRLFVSVKVPLEKTSEALLKDVYASTREILTAAGLNPQDVSAGQLVDWLRRFFNGYGALNNTVYDDAIPIAKQVIFAETDVEKKFSHMRIGKRYFKCISPKSFPNKVSLLASGELSGGIWGKISDMDQIRSPFLISVNIIFEDMKTKLHAKCNLVLQQQGVGSFAPSLKRKQEEYLWAVDELEKGRKFVKVMPVVWVWDEDEQKLNESLVRAKRLWEAQNYVMQQDRGILPILLISSLPFGLYTEGGNVETIDRYFIAPSDAASAVLPVQGDFTGMGMPYLLFVGRKGQLCTLDIFDRSANNHNILIAATTGAGKSFLVNYLSSRYYSAGAKVRIIDIGASYKKLCNMFGGRYIEFSKDSKVCMNPFSNIIDIESDLSVISSIILQMAFSSTEIIPYNTAETSASLIRAAVKWAYRNEGTGANIVTVYTYLNEFPKHADEYDFDCPDKEKCAEDFKLLAQTLAFNIHEFTSGQLYGRWFNGKATLDIRNDDFVVLELEHLKSQKELFKVITLQVINAVTQEMYLSGRDTPRFVIFDEAWQFLRDNRAIKETIDEGYRRARKYHGSFSVILQSILDLDLFGDVGQVINANSAFKFFLESADFEKAKTKNLIDYDDFTMKVLKSTSSNRPKYSEIFMHTPISRGVARLVVDPYNYYVNTSDARDITKIEQLVSEGMDYDQAIEKLVKEAA